MLDSYGRNIHYLRVSVTDRCNLRCKYCMPAEGVDWLPHDTIITFEQIRSVVRAAAELGFDKIRLTGGEPLARKGVLDLVAMLAAVDGIKTLAMTTNGTLLAPLAAKLAAAGLASVNISLDTLDAVEYAELTRGGRLEDALAGIRSAREAGLPVKLNMVVNEETPPENVERLRIFSRTEGCGMQTIRQYRLDQTKYDDSHHMRPPPCSDCNRIRLLANGELKPCLHGERSVPVDWSDPVASIRACVLMKPVCGESVDTHLVSAIGG